MKYKEICDRTNYVFSIASNWENYRKVNMLTFCLFDAITTGILFGCLYLIAYLLGMKDLVHKPQSFSLADGNLFTLVMTILK